MIARAGLALALVALTAAPALAQRQGGRAPQQQMNRGQQTRIAPVRPMRQQGNPSSRASAPLRLSSSARASVSSLRSEMESDIRGGATPFLEIVPAKDHVVMNQTEYPDYEQHTIAKYKVSGLGAGGALDLVTLMPVSGHVGWENAKNYAKTNTYNMTITHADGTHETLSGIKTQGFVTQQDLNLHLKPGKTVIEFWPDGSGGVGGYVAGRRIELDWNGK